MIKLEVSNINLLFHDIVSKLFYYETNLQYYDLLIDKLVTLGFKFIAGGSHVLNPINLAVGHQGYSSILLSFGVPLEDGLMSNGVAIYEGMQDVVFYEDSLVLGEVVKEPKGLEKNQKECIDIKKILPRKKPIKLPTKNVSYNIDDYYTTYKARIVESKYLVNEGKYLLTSDNISYKGVNVSFKLTVTEAVARFYESLMSSSKDKFFLIKMSNRQQIKVNIFEAVSIQIV